MASVNGVVLHCGKYGCIVRLADGRLANLPADEAARAGLRRLLTTTRRPAMTFDVTQADGWPILRVAQPQVDALDDERSVPSERSELGEPDLSVSTLDEKIIDYLRQTADWDPTGSMASRVQDAKQKRADRLLPSEERTRRQNRETPRKPRKKR